MAKYKFTSMGHENPWQLIGDDLSGWVWKHEGGREMQERVKKLKDILVMCGDYQVQKLPEIKRNIE